jgi:hypothetical protein
MMDWLGKRVQDVSGASIYSTTIVRISLKNWRQFNMELKVSEKVWLLSMWNEVSSIVTSHAHSQLH